MRGLAAVLLMTAATACADIAGTGATEMEDISLPEGFAIGVYAEDVPGARFMAVSPEGVLHATLIRDGRVVALPDEDRDGRADRAVTVAEGLRQPHGIAFHEGFLYVGETHQVVRFPLDKGHVSVGPREVVVPGLPVEGGGHFTRTVVFGPEGALYISIGSSCNVCREDDPRRAAVLRVPPEGGKPEVFAKGLRNSVGLAFHPVTGVLFGTENGRDWLGDDFPPDEINVIRQGRHYGWPACHGDRVPDPEFGDEAFCRETEPPAVNLQAHSAPLGLAFYTGTMFPETYRGRLFAAYHGSWNRSVPTGYKVVSIPFRDGMPAGEPEDFATGWLRRGDVQGRPVAVLVGADGALMVSDDKSGRIYRITFKADR
jgi:glucose/arabinose dehydrogenase